MKSPVSVSFAFLVLFLAIINKINLSYAQQNQPISNFILIDRLYNRIEQWMMRYQTHQSLPTRIQFTPPIVIAGVLSFIASSISSAGGIGGGGLYIPILTIVAGVDLKTASSLSAFMVTGGSIANVLSNFCSSPSKHGGKSLIDFDIALLTQPCMLLGVSIGVICNLVFPEWMITILFAIFLAWSTIKTFNSGIRYWKLETEELRNSVDEGLEDASATGDKNETDPTLAPLLNSQVYRKSIFPWMKLGVLILVWLSFYLIYLLRGNRYGQSIIPMETCGVAYWTLSLLQVPLTVAFTLWILHQQKIPNEPDSSTQKGVEETSESDVEPSKKLVFPLMALLAGLLGGMFGIGGGMLISPFLLQVGIIPEITAATCSFMVFFSSSMSACQYLLLGMEQAEMAVIFAIICFVASVIGSVVVQKAIHQYGRASLIIFSVSIVMALSIVLMTSFGVLHVINDYNAGKNMGFKSPC